MASTVVMQSILGTPVNTGLNNRNGVKHFAPSSYRLSQIQRSSNLRVKSSLSEYETEKEKTSPAAPPKATPQNVTPPPPPPQKPKTDLFDVFSFSGPGPERINGRLAMIGFVAAIGVELANGGDLFAQLSNGGVSWFLLTSALLTAASLVPLFQGVTAESKSEGLMTADAEIWNGRFAMLGLVALAFTEYVQNGPLLHV